MALKAKLYNLWMKGRIPVFEDVLRARERVSGRVRRTPVLTCSQLDSLSGASLFLKAEQLQRTGSFKFRGAANALFALSEDRAGRGVVTHSSGNFGQALAAAAKERGVRAYVVMPEDSAAVKMDAVRGYGAEVVSCAPTLEAREQAAEAVLQRTRGVFLHPYDDPDVIAGHGTAAFELLEQAEDLDCLIAPLGGGGLLSGLCLGAQGLWPGFDVFGAEPELADDACRSLKAGKMLAPREPRTIADGLRTGLCERTFAILRERVRGVLLCSEGEILKAMRLLWERAKTVVEPSGAAALAAVLREPGRFRGKRVGVLLSGGNVDLTPEKLSLFFNTIE